MGREVHQLKNTQAKIVMAEMDNVDARQLKFDEESIQWQLKEFNSNVKDIFMRKRLFAWKMHFIILNMAIILIVLSEHLEAFEKL